MDSPAASTGTSRGMTPRACQRTRNAHPSESFLSACRRFPAMDTNTQPDAIELIRLTDPGQSITVRLRSTEP